MKQVASSRHRRFGRLLHDSTTLPVIGSASMVADDTQSGGERQTTRRAHDQLDATSHATGSDSHSRDSNLPPLRVLLLSDSVDRFLLQWWCAGLGGVKQTITMTDKHLTPEVRLLAMR